VGRCARGSAMGPRGYAQGQEKNVKHGALPRANGSTAVLVGAGEVYGPRRCRGCVGTLCRYVQAVVWC